MYIGSNLSSKLSTQILTREENRIKYNSRHDIAGDKLQYPDVHLSRQKHTMHVTKVRTHMIEGYFLECLRTFLHLGVQWLQHCKHPWYVVLSKIHPIV